MNPADIYDWRPRFVICALVEGEWVFCRWIEVRRDYFRPLLEERRLPKGEQS